MPPKRKVGRPPKLTPELRNKICDYIRGGNYVETAAVAAGLDKKTLYLWMARANEELDRISNAVERLERLRGLQRHRETFWQDAREALRDSKVRRSERPYVEFLHAMDKAVAEGERRDIEQIEQAGKEDWRAVAWRLARRRRAHWGDTVKVDATVAGKPGQPLIHEHRVRVYIPDNGRQPLPEPEKAPLQLERGKSA